MDFAYKKPLRGYRLLNVNSYAISHHVYIAPDRYNPNRLPTRLVWLITAMNWYFARLAAMSWKELVHRIIERGKKLAWQWDQKGWAHFHNVGDGSILDLEFIRALLRDPTDVIGSDFLLQSIEGIRACNFELLGRSWPKSNQDGWSQGNPSPEFWFCDPVSGERWPGPERYCFSINYRRAALPLGDVKYVWELNRLQFLHVVAVYVAKTGDPVLARWALRIVANWARSNPPYRGVNWNSGIELALRIASVALLVSAVGPSAMEPDDRILVRRLIAAHGYWLHRFPSRFSSSNNHLIAEGFGLFIAGTLVPDLPRATLWAEDGRAIIEAATRNLILEDGVGAEQSPTYTAFTLEMIGFVVLVAAGIGRPVSQGLTDRVALGAEYLRFLLDDCGRAPEIGDDDEGRVIAQPPDRERRYVASVVAAVASLVKRDDLIPPARDKHIRDLLFPAPRQGVAIPDGVRVFPKGGYTVIRNSINKRRLLLVFDHGPLGYLPLAAHGHADALAIWLTLDDVPVFVDAGTYLYHSGGAMRDRLRETTAHNTLVVADKSQSKISGPFMWSEHANAHLVDLSPWPEWAVAAEHDGYEAAFGVRHQRRIVRTKCGVQIFDRLDSADRPLPVSLHFLCHPSLAVKTVDGRAFVIRDRGELLVEITPPLNFQIAIRTGRKEPWRGWYSPGFGQLVEAPLIVLSGEATSDKSVTDLTILPPT